MKQNASSENRSFNEERTEACVKMNITQTIVLWGQPFWSSGQGNNLLL